MSNGLRLRIITLQAVMVVAFAFGTGFLFWASNYVQNNVKSELAAQQITFPTKDNAEFMALPKSNQVEMGQYAGQTMTTGDQAHVYADYFIRYHLSEMHMTYSQASAVAMAHPNNVADQNLTTVIFKGTTLRSMLLNAYGWWTVGAYTGMAAILATLGAIVLFISLVFESLLAYRAKAMSTLRSASLASRAHPVKAAV